LKPAFYQELAVTVVRVALPVPLRQHFDYLIDAALQPQVGSRVLVPFGKRKLVGIIWQLDPADSFDNNKLKAVTVLLDDKPVLPPLLCQLLSFAADYYHYPLGEVLISALPALLREGRNLADYQPKAYQLSADGKLLEPSALKRSAKQQALWQALHNHQLTESVLLQQHSRATLKQLLDKQFVQEQIVPPTPFLPPATLAKGLQLTSAQALAVTAVTQAFGRLNGCCWKGLPVRVKLKSTCRLSAAC
jgi:primosomal protein N' (replication factor Y) (superfamily II helicase)